MDDSDKSLFELSYNLESFGDRRSFLSAAAGSIAQLLAVDHLGWIDVNPELTRLDMVTKDGAEQKTIKEALVRTVSLHPMFIGFSSAPRSLAPLRMSDLIPLRDWKRHVVYNDLFTLMGTTHQITLPVTPYALGTQAWVFNRATRDFSDEELAFTSRLRPLLATLNKASAHTFVADDAALSVGTETLGLTSRELEILQLLAQGFSSTQIGYYHRISTRTVEKHLQNAYAKLGAHDRVHAIRIAVHLHLAAL